MGNLVADRAAAVGGEEVGGAALVEGGVSCFGCLYDLRGREVAGVCPECGALVARSLDGRRLDWADRRWLRRVRWGVLLAGGEYVAPVVTYGVVSLVPGLRGDAVGAMTVGSIGACAGLGAWWMTGPERGRGMVKAGGLERVVRGAGLVAAAAILLYGVMLTVWQPYVTEWTKMVPRTAAVASVVLGLSQPVLVRRWLARVPGGVSAWPTWVWQGASAVSWGILGLAAGTDLLDNVGPVVLLIALALCVVPPAAAGWAWWVLGMRRRASS